MLIYDARSSQVKKTISRFHDVAFSGSFRYDGKVLVAGSANGEAHLFDVSSRTVLRTFKGHEGCVFPHSLTSLCMLTRISVACVRLQRGATRTN